MSKPKAVYIPRAVEQGVVGMFQESLIQALDYSPTVDPSKSIHASTVNFSVSSSDPYRSRLNIVLAVNSEILIFNTYHSLLQFYICKELASTLNMANSSVWIYFPQWYEPALKQKLTVVNRERLDTGEQFDGMPCVPETRKDVFSMVEGKYDWYFPRVGSREAVLNYSHPNYIASFKLSGREEFRAGLGSSRAGLSSKLYDKLYDETEFKIRVEVPLKIRYKQENLVQYLNVHYDELLYDQVLRAVNRPLEKEGNEIFVNMDMRYLHYKKVKGGMRQLQDFQIQIKDNQGQLVKFEDRRKSIMTLNFKPTKSKELSHFTQTVRCQLPHKLNEPIPLKTTGSWQVALMDITFPRRWINVKENEMGSTWAMMACTTKIPPCQGPSLRLRPPSMCCRLVAIPMRVWWRK